MRDHLTVVWKATGRKPPELELPPLAAALRDLWETYLEIAAARDGGGFGMAAIGWKDLAAWQQVTQCRLSPWEAETLVKIDRAVRAVLAKD